MVEILVMSEMPVFHDHFLRSPVFMTSLRGPSVASTLKCCTKSDMTFRIIQYMTFRIIQYLRIDATLRASQKSKKFYNWII